MEEQALFPAGRVFLQGYFADRLRDGDSSAISSLWRSGFSKFPVPEGQGISAPPLAIFLRRQGRVPFHREPP
jgi:hypothetical protein